MNKLCDLNSEKLWIIIEIVSWENDLSIVFDDESINGNILH